MNASSSPSSTGDVAVPRAVEQVGGPIEGRGGTRARRRAAEHAPRPSCVPGSRRSTRDGRGRRRAPGSGSAVRRGTDRRAGGRRPRPASSTARGDGRRRRRRPPRRRDRPAPRRRRPSSPNGVASARPMTTSSTTSPAISAIHSAIVTRPKPGRGRGLSTRPSPSARPSWSSTSSRRPRACRPGSARHRDPAPPSRADRRAARSSVHHRRETHRGIGSLAHRSTTNARSAARTMSMPSACTRSWT